jgi:hypothetical protein
VNRKEVLERLEQYDLHKVDIEYAMKQVDDYPEDNIIDVWFWISAVAFAHKAGRYAEVKLQRTK